MNILLLLTALEFGAGMVDAAKRGIVPADPPLAVRIKNDEAIVRKQSEAYTKALLGCDKLALANILHGDYLGERVKWGLYSDKPTDKVMALLLWNDPPAHQLFMMAGKIKRLEYKIESLRVFGDTAIESGTFAGEVGNNWYGDAGYLRVWLKTNGYWQLVQEQYR
jgi:hypothetical protein